MMVLQLHNCLNACSSFDCLGHQSGVGWLGVHHAFKAFLSV